jgi:hypothetical protein
MQKKSISMSTEVLTGMGMIVVGLLAKETGAHGLLADAMAPFGVGVILSDIMTRAGKAARERAKVRIRRDE